MTTLKPRDSPSRPVVATVAAELWRARRYVLVAALAATTVGLTMSYRIGFPPTFESRGRTVGTASVLALVDTPRSQVVNLSPSTRGVIAMLSARAQLLATLMVSSPIREEIARGAGIDPGELIIIRPSTLADRRRRVPPPQVSSISGDDPGAHILHVAVTPLAEGEHPIIAVDARAPDAAAAGRLAGQAVRSLKAHLDEEARLAAVPPNRRVVVRQFEPPEATSVRVEPSKLFVLTAALIVFAAGCAAGVLRMRLRRRAPRSRLVAGSTRLRRPSDRARRLS